MTLDDLIDGMLPPVSFLKNGATMEAVGITHSLFYTAGVPGAAAAPSPGLNGAALTSYAGQIPFPAAVGGKVVRLAGFEFGGASQAGTLMLMDRLWHNSGIVATTTTAQAITSGAMPARDRDGATTGAGLIAALEVSAATTNAGAITNTTLNYTNTDGTAGRTGTITSFPATAAAGTTVFFNLQAGDTGIQTIQGITLGTSLVTGTVHLVVYRLLAQATLGIANAGGATKDAIALGAPILYENTTPCLLWQSSATAALTLAGGNVIYSQVAA